MATTRIARFNIMVTATASQVAKVFNDLGKQAKTFGGSFTASLTTASFAFNQISGAARSILGPIQETASQLDNLAKTSRKLDVDPAFLQSWRLAGELSGVAAEQIDKSLTIMQKRVGEFQLGINKDVGILGLGQSDLTGNFEGDLQKIVAGINKFDTQTERAAAATRLFGREAAALLPLFTTDVVAQSAKDLESWNGALSSEQLANVENMNDAWTRTTQAIAAVRNEIVVELAPQLTQFFDLIREFVPSFGSVWRTIQIGFTQLIQTMVNGLGSFFGFLDRMLQKIGVDALSGFKPFLDTYSEELEFQMQALEQRGKDAADKITTDVAQVVQEIAKPANDPFLQWLTQKNAQLMGKRLEQFGLNFGATVRSVVASAGDVFGQITGTGAVQAGTVEAAKYQFGRVQDKQLDVLKVIEKNTRGSGNALLQTGLQIVLGTIT